MPSTPVCAESPDGELCTPTWVLKPGFARTGGRYWANDSRTREYQGASFTFNKRLANGWSARGFINYGSTEWNVPESYLALNDPNPTEIGDDQDGAVFVEESSGSGRGNIFLNSEWQWNLTGMYQVAPDRPWGFNLSANLYGRQGYPVPYQTTNTLPGLGSRALGLLGSNNDKDRLDSVETIDLRGEKEFAATSNVSLTFSLALFNALNDATVLARNNRLNIGTAYWIQDTLAPRTWQLGVRVSWR
jgi:hypothetical protein